MKYRYLLLRGPRGREDACAHICVFVHIYAFGALSCIPSEIYTLQIPPHASSLPKSSAPSFPAVNSAACRFLSALLSPFPSSSQQLAATGYYWSALTSISADRGVSHQNTHTCTNTSYRHESLLFFPTNIVLLFRWAPDNHGNAPSLNDRNKNKRERETKRRAEQTAPPLSFFGDFSHCVSPPPSSVTSSNDSACKNHGVESTTSRRCIPAGPVTTSSLAHPSHPVTPSRTDGLLWLLFSFFFLECDLADW